MRCRPLALALSLALLPPVAHAEDLLQAYQLARASDPQLAAAEAGQRATAEGQVQTRAQFLPQVNGGASLTRQRQTSESGQAQFRRCGHGAAHGINFFISPRSIRSSIRATTPTAIMHTMIRLSSMLYA